MKNPIPPHIAWPAFIILLLLGGIGSTFAALYASKIDGGPRVVDDYYRKAANWEQTMAARKASERLGWRATAAAEAAGAGGARRVTLTVVDSAGAPVAGLRGAATLYRPQSPAPLAEQPLAEVAPGRYLFTAPMPERGLWDIELKAQRGDTTYAARVRTETH